ncbi:hypothetical protein [Absidia glauca]|uniref:EF-hand domain-containing protein n=1 Tax=Absidia glauca TaxID=4829 RepID=A0A168RAR9_ABSGL|nr:hypothetical protein [Absidia glauca]
MIVMSLDPTMTEESATLLAGEIDTKGKGTIGFDGFVCAMVKLAPFTNTTTSLPEHVELRKWNTCPPHLRNTRHEEDDLMDCFRAFDTNHDGLISRAELEKVMCKLGEKLSKQDIQDMMAEADSNEDGYIDFEEFKHLLS